MRMRSIDLLVLILYEQGPRSRGAEEQRRKRSCLTDLIFLLPFCSSAPLLLGSLFHIVLLFVLSVSIVQAQNVSLTEYTVPVSQSQTLTVDVNYNYSTVGRKRSDSGNLSGIYRSFYDSLPYGYSIDFNILSSRIRKADSKAKNNFISDAFGTVKKYIFEERQDRIKDVFTSARLHGAFQKTYDRPAFDLALGFGFGRFVNATALAKASRIEAFLLKEGLTSDYMPKQTMLDLGHIIERKNAYEERYGPTYQKWWFEDMENSIRRSEKLKGKKIDAVGILRMQEVLFRENVEPRFYGYDVTLGVKFDLLTSSSNIERPKPSADIAFRYAHPISWQLQFNSRLVANTPFGKEAGDIYKITFAPDLTYEMTNRIDVAMRYFLSADKPEPKADILYSNSFSVRFSYYIENQISLTSSLELNKTGKGKLSQQFVVTMNYRIL